MMTNAEKQVCKVNIRIAVPEDRQAWDAYVDSRPGTSPYCLFAWKEAVEQAYGHQGCYLIAENSSKIVGILPLFIFRIPFKPPALVSLPYCDMGGIIADSKDTQSALLYEAIALGQKYEVGKIEIRSNQQDLVDINDSQGLHKNTNIEKVRMLLDLPGSSDELWNEFKSKLRSQVRKSQKNGLIFRWGKREDLAEFYKVFSRNMHDLGSPTHSKKWIEKIFVCYGENARMGLVYKDQRPVGCGIILLTSQTVSIPWASTLRDYNRLSPNMMLYWTFLKYAADTGKKVFDFGRSTPNEGTYRFKKQWGAESETLYWYNLTETELQKGPSGNKIRDKLELIWQKMPLPAANFIGPMVRKYISL
jgi:FemAB-related protein (PEP-CTERM system-associated)